MIKERFLFTPNPEALVQVITKFNDLKLSLPTREKIEVCEDGSIALPHFDGPIAKARYNDLLAIFSALGDLDLVTVGEHYYAHIGREAKDTLIDNTQSSVDRASFPGLWKIMQAIKKRS